jgi:hypothetical protein
MPKPVQPGGVPVWVSGRINRRTVERIVRFGSGWIPWAAADADPRPGIAAVREALALADRDPFAVGVQNTLPVIRNAVGTVDVPGTIATVPDLVVAGVTDFRLAHDWAADPDRERTLAKLVHEFQTATASG